MTPEFVEALRRRALNGEGAVEPFLSEAAQRVGLSTEKLTAFVETLRRRYQIDRRWASAQKEHITRTGSHSRSSPTGNGAAHDGVTLTLRGSSVLSARQHERE